MNFPLIAGARIGAEHQLAMIHLFQRGADLTEVIAPARPRRSFEFAVDIISVLVLINIDDGVSAKINRIGTRGPAAVVLVGIKNLRRERLPPAG